MRPETQEPVESAGLQDGKAYDHPAFGQISVSRVSGHAVLYGSDFLHQHYVTIRIHRSQLNRDLSRDWHFGRDELVEVSLSEAQWATFVSSIGMGGGVPCTLERVMGKRMPLIPLRVEEDEVRGEAEERMKRAAARVRETMAAVEEAVGVGLSKAKRDAILKHLTSLERDLGDQLPFIAKSFAEHMETTVEKAKVEVNAYMQATVQRAGLAALAAAEGMPLQIGSGDNEQEG